MQKQNTGQTSNSLAVWSFVSQTLVSIDIQLSLGDFVLSGGEIAALALLDAVARLLPGVLHDDRSHHQDSFAPALDGLLDCPHYSRPEHWRPADMDTDTDSIDGGSIEAEAGAAPAALSVPTVLLSGHQAKIERWRRDQCLALTARHRPDLLAQARAAGRLDAGDEAALKAAAVAAAPPAIL